MGYKDAVFFPYEPPIELGPGVTGWTNNILRVVQLFVDAKTPEETQMAGDIYQLVARIEVAEKMQAVRVGLNKPR